MKKTLTLLLTLLIFSGMAFAQHKPVILESEELQRGSAKEMAPEFERVQNPDFAVPKSIIYHWGFEDDPIVEGWLLEQLNDDAWRDWGPSADAYAGETAGYHKWIDADAKSWLISPPITLSELEDEGNYALRFFEKNFWMDDYTHSSVRISTKVIDEDNPFDPADFTQIYESDEVKDVYTETIVDLSGYDDNTVRIAFVYQGQNGHNWWIDEVIVAKYFDNDFSLVSLAMDPAVWFFRYSEDIELHANVKNVGYDKASKEVTFWAIDIFGVVDPIEIATVATAELDFEETETVVTTWNPSEEEKSDMYTIFEIVTELEDDDFVANNETSEDVEVVGDDQIAVDFEGGEFPEGWAQSGHRKNWNVSAGSFYGNYGLRIGLFDGDPEEVLLTSPFELDGTYDSFEYYVRGLNNIYGLGSAKLTTRIREFEGVKEDDDDWGEWVDLAYIDFATGDFVRYQYLDLSGYDDGVYQIGFFAYTSFWFPGYMSWIYLDDLLGPDPAEEEFNVPYGSTEIVSFDFGDDAHSTVIDRDAGKIDVVLAYGVDITALNPTVTIKEGAEMDPHPNPDYPNGEVDFTGAQFYWVDYGPMYRGWTVTVKNSYQITFAVKDAAGTAITDATLVFLGDTLTEAPYVFEYVAAGQYPYEVSKDGYFTTSLNAYVKATKTIPVTLNIDDTFVDAQDDINLVIFPNPARDRFTVEAGENISKIRMISISGQIVKDLDIDAQRADINVSELHTGVYFMQIHTANRVITERVQITR